MHAMTFDDRPDEARRLEEARIAKGFATAKAAAEYFGWSYDSYIQHENGIRGLSRATARYAKAFKVSEGWLRFGEGEGPAPGVPLKGYIGAGQTVISVSDGDPDATVDAPAERNDQTVAAIVRGDSMMPAFRDGWLIYWSKQLPPADMLNQLCVAQLATGEIYIKVLKRGSRAGLWTLQSFNATTGDIEDRVVSWVAPIDWIKPR